MNKEQLFEQIKKKKSFLCVGLDTDIAKLPHHLKNLRDFSGMLEFNKRIVDSTHELAVAYKPNLAFYERFGRHGWEVLEETVDYIRSTDPSIFIIADAKRGDIGNTSDMYAQGFFNMLKVDAVTVAPYMGEDSITPFLKYPGKWTIMLALTSNPGASDFQQKRNPAGFPMYLDILVTSRDWENASDENMMYVVGATKATELAKIRQFVPDHFLLVPGVGAQGGSLEEVAKYGMNAQCGLLVNSSRAIIYAGLGCGLDERHFALHARSAALKVQQEMAVLLQNAGLL